MLGGGEYGSEEDSWYDEEKRGLGETIFYHNDSLTDGTDIDSDSHESEEMSIV